ncbi:MAG: 1-deoxy-D-xylulose-5-phosphate synthase, partial [Kordiimonadaceae bacterium]|nr:1-deoxy-D-xylulose-5-phosphate synthase [Kordiimonadaceae bacterium]
FGSHILDYLSNEGLMEQGLKVRTLKLPDIFIDQDSPDEMYKTAGLTSEDIIKTALHALGHNDLNSTQING